MATSGTITINGPYWSAEAEVLAAPVAGNNPTTPERSILARLLFVDQTPQAGSGKAAAFLPGTLLVLCSIRSVDIRPDTGFIYHWSRSADAPVPDVQTASGIETAVRSGNAALLVLRADPNNLAKGVNTFDCLNGEISLDAMTADGNALARLYGAIGVTPPSQPVPDYGIRRQASVHASGVSLYGQVQFPWELHAMTLPLQIAQVIPTPDKQRPAYRLTIETDRLTAEEERLIIRSWRLLSSYLNPKNPLNEQPAAPETPTPIWMTLELSNPLAVPRLYASISPWQTTSALTSLNIEPSEVNLLITDQQPYDRDHPLASLARVTLRSIRIARADLPNETSSLTVQVEASSDNPAGKGSIQYDWSRDKQTETMSLKDLEVGFEPVQTANFLRQQQGIPAPEWLPDVDHPQPLSQPILWGFMPLEDGWAELPFLNLTAQIFLDAKIGPFNPPDTVAPFMLQGAVAIGNDHDAVLRNYRDEQPWNLTLSDAQHLTGTWLLTGVTNGYQLTSVSATFSGPEATLNGLLWLSTGRPSAEDAIPDLTDWIGGLESIALKTVDPAFDLFPPPVILKLSDLSFALRDGYTADNRRPSAWLSAWNFSFQTNPLSFDALIAKHVLPAEVFSSLLPLLWRRHPTLPMIQALPLTQSKNPPTFPGASRQLVPFQLSDDPTTWVFNVTGINAAQRWPVFPADPRPAVEWVGENHQRSDLPLVSLSLPGLVLDPALADDSALGNKGGLKLPVQYRFDLPYLDQLNALAQVPAIPRDPKEVSPLPDQTPPPPPPPLQRDTYAGHWERLSEQASLAAADAVDAFVNQTGNQFFVNHLVEPYRWPVNPTAATDDYPGSLLLADQSTNAQQILTGESALKSVSGRFTLDGGNLILSKNGNQSETFDIQAGSMASHPQNGGFRDQRGLTRQATLSVDSGAILQTPVQLEREQGLFDHYLLTSLLAPVPMFITATSDVSWRFWARDLPVNAETSSFTREDVRSRTAELRNLDINDPEALAREYNYRQGYEWRLGVDSSSEDYLTVGGLRFFPLTLESVYLSPAGHIIQVEIIGRLQLGLSAPGEITELSNAVKLTFEEAADGSALLLNAVRLVSPVGEWPLALTPNNEIADAPLLVWKEIALKNNDTHSWLEVSGIQLNYFLFDVEWVLPLAENLTFYLNPDNPTNLSRVYHFDYDETAPIYPLRAEVTLELAAPYQHSCDIFVNLQLGNRVRDGLAARYTFHQGSDPLKVVDVTGGSTPLSLTITTPDAMKWNDEGLEFYRPSALTALTYSGPASFVGTIGATGEFSIEMWLTPNLSITAPIMTLKQGGLPGFRVSQTKDTIEAQLGSDTVLTGKLPNNPVYVVFSRDTWGISRLYINGILVGSPISSATDLKKWNSNIQMALGNEINGGTPWSGIFHQLSICYQALNADEVMYRYQLGAQGLALRASFRAEMQFSLLRDGAPVNRDMLEATTLKTSIFDDISIEAGKPIFLQGRSLQFQWNTQQPREDGQAIYLLPGMALNNQQDSPGFAVVTFDARTDFALNAGLASDLDHPTATIALQQYFSTAGYSLSNTATIVSTGQGEWLISSGRDGQQVFSVRQLNHAGSSSYRVYAGIPRLRLTTAFMETMLTCSWGESLQNPRPMPNPDGYRPSAFGSSAGDILFNYTTRLQTDSLTPSWDETFLLNGMVEITNLVSWPLGMSPMNSQLQLPALRGAAKLDHLRHTIRILFNQHEIPPQVLAIGEGPLVFSFAGRKAWQFLAVVEHQLLDTILSRVGNGWNTAFDGDRRWTALQEVRWASPRAFGAFLNTLKSGEVVTPFDISNQLTTRISSGADDVNEDDNKLETNLATIWLGNGTKGSYTGLRFTNLAIPPNAVIVSARLHITTPKAPDPKTPNAWISMSFEVAAEAADSSQPFSNTSLPSKRTLTTARVKHSSNDSWLYETAYDLPNDIAPLIQEVIRRPGWRSGNNLSLIIHGTGNQFGRKFIVSADGNAAQAVQLVIAYTVPSRNPYTHGYFEPGFRGMLENTLPQLPPDMLLVEASAAHWIKRTPIGSTTTTSLQYLPFGAQAAILSSPDDFKTTRTNPPADGNDWLLLTMPFIGRMQPEERDIPSGNSPVYPLRIDPVLEIAPFASQTGSTPKALALALTNWADSAPATLALLDFDTYAGRLFPHLDSMSLEENWMRLQNPLTEPVPPGLRSIAASLVTTPGRLSRSLALRHSADSFRPAYPPAPVGLMPPEEPSDEGLIWRQHSLIVFQSSTSPSATISYPWAYVGLQAREGLHSSAETGVLSLQRYASATLLPTPPRLQDKIENRTPVSFAVSPYLGLEMLYGDLSTPLLIEGADQAGAKTGELLCIDATTGSLRPVASFMWEFRKVNSGGAGETIGWKDMDWDDWAIGTHQRLSSESLVAVLRFRELMRTGDRAESPLVVRYSYRLVEGISLPPRLNQRTHRVRSSVEALRFRQGQYGGKVLPIDLHTFEVAPPQTIGLQPFYLTASPLAGEPWPWGVSGLRVSVEYTEGQRAVLDTVPAQDASTRLWWQTFVPVTQFRSAEYSGRRAASLPHVFRAPAIRSLLPVLPNPPMPLVGTDQLGTIESDSTHSSIGWQSILPGLLRYLVTGSRAGVMFALRNLVMRQDGLTHNGGSRGETVISGSVPAQHRFPRPVPLPPNQPHLQTSALQTWASYFEPEKNVLITTSPADEAFFAAFQTRSNEPTKPAFTKSARRLRLVLHDPVYGALPSDWDGNLTFDVITEQAVPRIESWELTAVLSDSTTRLQLTDDKTQIGLVKLLDIAGIWKPNTSIDEIGSGVLRGILEGENILPIGQQAVFNPDQRWTIRLIVDGNPMNVLVYDNGDGLSIFTSPDDQHYTFKWHLTDVSQQPTKPHPADNERLPQLGEIKTGLSLGDASALIAAITPLMKAEAAKDLKIDIVTPNPVQLHWLITDTDVRQTYATVVPNGNSWSVYSLRIRFNVSEADRDKLVSSSLNLSVRIGHHLVTKGFELALNFPLNKVNNRRLPLPFEPYFIQFEDPEYNRLLASNTAHATRIVKDQVTTDAGLQQVGHSVTLSTDRREYNADSEVTLRYDWDDDRTYTGTIQIGYLGIVPSENPPLILPSTTMLSSGTLARYNLAELVQAYNKFQESANRIKLSPGDRVQVKVTVHGTGMSTPVPIVLELPIIQKPITPSPQAGFGLLRSNQLDEQRWVECARFAWTPEATRVEMVCAEDLRTEIVRRRAVFQWRDSARPNRSTLYAIQKITLMGSTHFPWVE